MGMFSTERSDFGSTIAGYLFSAILLLFAGLQLLNQQFDMFETSLDVPFRTLALLLVCASAIALWIECWFVLDRIYRINRIVRF